MTRLLITGATSYVGVSVANYLKKWPDEFQVDAISLIDGSWRETSFRGYDAVFHVAGIVHDKKTKDDPAQAELYDRVNHRLAVETARKAKDEGVGQFIFMSTAGVYGLTAPLGQELLIRRDTALSPSDNYGTSKLRAEEDLRKLADDHFRMVILRPPMIYGKGCKGNYVTLAKLAKKLPIFPKVENRRSVLYIDNLSELIRLLLEDRAEGTYCPQDSSYISTSWMVKQIARENGRRICLVGGFTWMLKLLRKRFAAVDKAFGSLCYDPELSAYPRDYHVKTPEAAIRETEGIGALEESL